MKYDPADTTDNKAVTWESSDKSVATVDANGKVTALKDGSATITAKVGKLTATCALTVQEKKQEFHLIKQLWNFPKVRAVKLLK